MAKFCGKCGAPVSDTQAFCNSCGTRVADSTAPAASAPSTPYQPVAPVQTYSQPVQSAAPAKSGSGLKILLIVLGVLVVGALAVVGGLFYVGHKVVSKIEDKAAEAGFSPSDMKKSDHQFQGDPCRFLSRRDVSEAIGVTITETKSSGDSCEYLAHGTAANMTSKHLAAMTGRRGADQATQDKFQKLAEGVFETQQKNAEATDPNGTEDTTVLALSFDQNSAQTQMKQNSKVLGAFGAAGGSSKLEGIGDEAFVAADGMMFVRKGDTLIRITYISCPCNTEQIKPLAKKLAAAL
ncbi:MAG: zinc ribbon domain-containing protein [Edaphobacter sp.]